MRVISGKNGKLQDLPYAHKITTGPFGAVWRFTRSLFYVSPQGMAAAVSAFKLQILFCPQVRSLSNRVARRSMMGFSEGSDAENGFDRGR
jgi:hypothetical protein